MSGELAERILIGEHKLVPKFDNANLEVSKVYYHLNNPFKPFLIKIFAGLESSFLVPVFSSPPC
jgi:hypothetical protein